VKGCNSTNLNKSLKKCLSFIKINPTLFELIEKLDSIYDNNTVWSIDAISEYSIGMILLGTQFPPDKLIIGGISLLCLVIRNIMRGKDNAQTLVLKGVLKQYPINLEKLEADYKNKLKDVRIRDVIADIFNEYIISRHIEVAIRKLYIEGLATFRIVKDEGCFRKSDNENDYVSKTSPRLEQALQILSDMKITRESREGFIINDRAKGREYFKDILSGS
jgi:hypothetical protein